MDTDTRCVIHSLEIPLRCEIIFLDYEVGWWFVF
ncbi:unnamed protein product [Trichobilharzia regenti]|nr:unnamed protein product [Trichobilharzia regenti]